MTVNKQSRDLDGEDHDGAQNGSDVGVGGNKDQKENKQCKHQPNQKTEGEQVRRRVFQNLTLRLEIEKHCHKQN